MSYRYCLCAVFHREWPKIIVFYFFNRMLFHRDLERSEFKFNLIFIKLQVGIWLVFRFSTPLTGTIGHLVTISFFHLSHCLHGFSRCKNHSSDWKTLCECAFCYFYIVSIPSWSPFLCRAVSRLRGKIPATPKLPRMFSSHEEWYIAFWVLFTSTKRRYREKTEFGDSTCSSCTIGVQVGASTSS